MKNGLKQLWYGLYRKLYNGTLIKNYVDLPQDSTAEDIVADSVDSVGKDTLQSPLPQYDTLQV